MSKPRLLWIGDYGPTGFGRVTNSVCRSLCTEWDVDVLGINYYGDPYQEPFRVWPASRGGDGLGLGRFQSMVRKTRPAAVIINSDPWNVAHFRDQAALTADCPPIIAYMPIDSPFQIKAKVAAALCDLTTAVWYTEFGQREAEKAGVRTSSAVIPHGIDLGIYRPIPRDEARASLPLPVSHETFVVGNVNRNQPRKRLDLTIDYFGAWLQKRGGKDFPAVLYLHTDPFDVGVDIPHLVYASGLVGKVLWPAQVRMADQKVFPERKMSAVYASCDVQVTTTLGEGWGLTQMESMACGVPQIVPRYSALGEWANGAVEYVPVSSVEAHSNYESGGIGGVVDKQAFVAALDRLYDNHARRAELGRLGRELVERPEFRWEQIASQFDAVLRDAVERFSVPSIPRARAEAVPC